MALLIELEPSFRSKAKNEPTAELL